MAGAANETAPVVVPFGSGDYFNGCERFKVTTLVKLNDDLTQRFIEALDARDKTGKINSEAFRERITPIGKAVGKTLRDRLIETQPEPLCRKGNVRNCGVGVAGLDSFAYKTHEGEIKADIPAHVSCNIALMPMTTSNEAAAAPVAVENALPELQFDLGCLAQMTAAAELTGQLMLEQLLIIEAAKAEQVLPR